MQNMKSRRRKHSAAVYTVFLSIWILILAGITLYIWNTVTRFGEYWEAAQITPKVDEYMEKLSVELWEDGEYSIPHAISQMEHEFQTNEECVEVLRGIMRDELRCTPAVGTSEDGTKTYDLVCGRNKFGRIFLTQDVFEPEENAVLNWMIEKYSLYPWHVSGVEFYLDGLYTSFDITVPQDFTVLLNGHPLTADYIVETGIPYNVLQEYYGQFDGLPTKVRYHADRVFGHVEYQLLNAKGEPTEINSELDDSQFIEPVSDELMARFGNFVTNFSNHYLEFSAGTGNMSYLYGQLSPYILPNSDLSDRLYRMIDSYAGWQHNSNYRFYDATLNGAISLGNGFYVLDASANAGSQMPAGFVEVHRDMKIYVKVNAQSNEIFAFSVLDYNTVETTEESDNVG